MYTAAQVRQLDRSAIDTHGISGAKLMERAGRVTFDAIRAHYPDFQRWSVCCGGGNNGGDGYVVARLAKESGIECALYALKSPDSLSGDAARAARRWLDAGGQVVDELPEHVDAGALLVDALLGTGLDRPAEGAYREAIGLMNRSPAPVVAVDIPSGLNADTGQALGGLAVCAKLTVTFIGRKRGLYTADGPDHCGTVEYSDLEVPESVYETIPNSGILIQEKVIANLLRPRARNSHKGDYGWVLGIGGDRGMSGALMLCGGAAMRAGAGKITLLTHPDHAAIINVHRPELMVRGIGGGAEATEFIESCDVLVVGTGLGQSAWSRSVLDAALGTKKSVVVDADGLNLIAETGNLDVLAELEGNVVITPHPAEAGRLLGVTSQEVQSDRVSAAQTLAARCGAVVVLKGCGSVIAEPGGGYAICPLGNPGMASGGTGDVLAGVIGALLAQGLDAWSAAQAGVVAHAAAGDRVARELGERGMLAGDVIDRLPAVLNPR